MELMFVGALQLRTLARGVIGEEAWALGFATLRMRMNECSLNGG